MTNQEHAKKLVKLLYERPHLEDSEGYYELHLDIQQMEDIVEKYLDKLNNQNT